MNKFSTLCLLAALLSGLVAAQPATAQTIPTQLQNPTATSRQPQPRIHSVFGDFGNPLTDGTYVYVPRGPNLLEVYDAKPGPTMRLRTRLTPPFLSVRYVDWISQGVLLLYTNNEYIAWDVRDLQQPRIVGRLTVAPYVAAPQSYLFAIDQTRGRFIYAEGTAVGAIVHFVSFDANGLTLRASLPITKPTKFVLSPDSNRLYVVRLTPSNQPNLVQGELTTYNTEDLAAVRQIAQVRLPGLSPTPDVADSLLLDVVGPTTIKLLTTSSCFMGSCQTNQLFYNVGEPAKPQAVANFPANIPDTRFLNEGTFTLAISKAGRLDVYDLRDPRRPSLRSSYQSQNWTGMLPTVLRPGQLLLPVAQRTELLTIDAAGTITLSAAQPTVNTLNYLTANGNTVLASQELDEDGRWQLQAYSINSDNIFIKLSELSGISIGNPFVIDDYAYWQSTSGLFATYMNQPTNIRLWNNLSFSKQYTTVQNKLYQVEAYNIKAIDRRDPLSPKISGVYSTTQQISDVLDIDGTLILSTDKDVSLLDDTTLRNLGQVNLPTITSNAPIALGVAGQQFAVAQHGITDAPGDVHISLYNLDSPAQITPLGNYRVTSSLIGAFTYVARVIVDNNWVHLLLINVKSDSSIEASIVTISFDNPTNPILQNRIALGSASSEIRVERTSPGVLLRFDTGGAWGSALTFIDTRQPGQGVESAPYKLFAGCNDGVATGLLQDGDTWLVNAYGCGSNIIQRLDLRDPVNIRKLSQTPSVPGELLQFNSRRIVITNPFQTLILLDVGPTTAQIAPTGGTISAGRATVSFPTGAFANPTDVTLTEGDPWIGGNIGQLTFTGATFELSAANWPTQPFALTVQYRPTDAYGVDPATLNLYRYDGTAWVLEPVSTRDTATRTLTFTPRAFGWFALMGMGKRTHLPLVRS